jgi:predicted O-methyltransferase YrrM
MPKKKQSTPVRRTTAEDFVDFERRRYAKEWEITSSHLAATRCYEWMADRLGTSGLILEIGCGNGLSTIELARRGNKVIAIEENTACLKKAKRALEDAGYSVLSLPRGKVRASGPQQHQIVYADVTCSAPKDFDVVLIEGNLLKDQKLFEYLRRVAPFDGIVCWLIGTHSGMAFNSCIDFSETPSPMHYRLKVQNSIYEIADVLLRASGVLHIVDRGQTPTSQELIDDFFSSHKDQASVTSIVPTDFDHRSYEEPPHEDATKMIVTIPVQGSLESITGVSLLSVRSLKPNG